MLFASSAAVAQDSATPAASPSTSAGGATSAAPANAPILLSPGVSPEPPKATHQPPKVKEPPADTRVVERQWFGWQTIVVDLTILGATGVTLRTTETENHLAVFFGGTALFLAAGPLIHLANGSGRPLASLIIRGLSLAVGSAVGMYLIGGLAGCSNATPCKLELVDFAALGSGLGAMFATTYDGSVLAWKPVAGAQAFVTPNVARVPGGATVGLNVTF